MADRAVYSHQVGSKTFIGADCKQCVPRRVGFVRLGQARPFHFHSMSQALEHTRIEGHAIRVFYETEFHMRAQ